MCIFFCSSVFLVFARENTIFLRVLCHFLRFCLVLPFPEAFFGFLLRLPCHFLRFSDIFAFFRFSQGKHTLPGLFLGKIRFSWHFRILDGFRVVLVVVVDVDVADVLVAAGVVVVVVVVVVVDVIIIIFCCRWL